MQSMEDDRWEKTANLHNEEASGTDLLTGLYSYSYGSRLADRYLARREPYTSCGLIFADIDFLEQANETYGYVFGDVLLKKMAEVLIRLTGPEDLLMRTEGDSFVAFLKGVSHAKLVEKGNQLIHSVRELTFPGSGYHMTCSAGICFVPENESGYICSHLVADARWALQRAVKRGRDRYEFCDHLHRFDYTEDKTLQKVINPQKMYFHEDMITTALELFALMSSFDAAIDILLDMMGSRYGLDRIMVWNKELSGGTAERTLQWADHTLSPVAFHGPMGKEDYLKLFRSYDEYGTAVIQKDESGGYSEEAADILFQGDAETILYAAMYDGGTYRGGIAYVVCGRKRSWTKEERHELSLLTKIIAAYLYRKESAKAAGASHVLSPEYDSLTGLLSFSSFREEAQKVMEEHPDVTYLMVYSDFEGFKYFNKKLGYCAGDQLLKEFGTYLFCEMGHVSSILAARIVADRFAMFFAYDGKWDAAKRIREINGQFISRQAGKYGSVRLNIRSGIYRIPSDCSNISAAIDAANFARIQAKNSSDVTVVMYDEEDRRKQELESEIISRIDEAMQHKEFLVYLQPKFSLEDFSIVGAEALVRWRRQDGTMLYPDSFVPIYENNGRIVDLDFYVFEQVAAYLAKNERLGRKQVPISINASILHAPDPNTVGRYLEILERYHINPSLTEIELTETATVSDYGNVKRLFKRLQEANMMTSMDDFGAGYSVLNTVIDIPVNTVKLDRAFITSCESSEKGIFLLKQIVAMVKGLGYHVVCEGIETLEQAKLLHSAGCEHGQGYWFARPMPIADFEKMMYH